MEIATTLVLHLAKLGIAYDVVKHDYSHSSLHSAHAAQIPASNVVKSVVLEDDKGYVMALVPANRHVKINEINMAYNRRMGLATEPELDRIFSDCDQGAIPPVGDAYGMSTIVDQNLDECEDLYIEAGTHTELLHISGGAFRKLMEHSLHGSICVH
jgi:Ala-tRNA(Pro) deacylase